MRCSRCGEILRLSVFGSLVRGETALFMDTVELTVRNSPDVEAITLDLSAVSRVDGFGLAALMYAKICCTKAHKRLEISEVPQVVAEELARTSLSRHFVCV